MFLHCPGATQSGENENELTTSRIFCDQRVIETKALKIDVGDNNDLYRPISRRKFVSVDEPLLNQSPLKKSAFPLHRLGVIGRGSSSTVYKAIHLRTLIVVADKVVVSADQQKQQLLVSNIISLSFTHNNNILFFY